MKGKRIYAKALQLAYEQPDNLKGPYELLLKAIKVGNADAAYAVSSWYYFGKYLSKDLTKAVELLQLAAEQHHPKACLHLAMCHEKGEGTKKDEAKAFEYYLCGALTGDKECMQEVGRFYWYGLGSIQKIKKLLESGLISVGVYPSNESVKKIKVA